MASFRVASFRREKMKRRNGTNRPPYIFMLCAILVTADDGHLGMQNCKRLKWLHTRNILAKAGSRVLEIVVFMFMLFLVTAPGGHLE